MMNGRDKIPVGEWQNEQKKLLEKRYRLCDKYYTLKEEVQTVEVIRRSVENPMRDEPNRTQPTRTQGMDR